MYMDSLTIAALVVFVIFFGVFIKYCLLSVCGSMSSSASEDEDESN